MADIKDLQREVVKFRDERKWQKFHNPKDMALSLVLESSELLEHFQWRENKEFIEYYETHSKDVNDEVMDVLYWVLLISYDLNIDIAKEFKRKMQKNAKKYPVAKAKGNHKKYTELK